MSVYIYIYIYVHMHIYTYVYVQIFSDFVQVASPEEKAEEGNLEVTLNFTLLVRVTSSCACAPTPLSDF